MKPSSFQTTIENQFDYICKRAMEDERKNYMLYLSRIAKREVSFSDVGDYLVSQFATTDNYSTDFQIFTLNGLSVGVENDLLSDDISKAKLIYLSYLTDKYSEENFYQRLVDCFLAVSEENDLLTNISSAFGIEFSDADRNQFNEYFGGE